MPERFARRMKPERPPENPWLIRGIVIAAVVVVAVGVVASLLLGHFVH
jgi:uncharacterized BrkB/YihY/UPF0761 family membrane protein